MVKQSALWTFTPQGADLSDNRDERYRRLGLTMNPFPSVGIAPERPLYSLVEPVNNQLHRFIQDFIGTRESSMAVITGDYGTGKTYALRTIQENLAQERLQEQKVSLRPKVVYLPSAGYEAYTLLMGILNGFGRAEVTRIIWRLLLDDIEQRSRNGGHGWVNDTFADAKKKLTSGLFQDDTSGESLSPASGKRTTRTIMLSSSDMPR